MLLGCRVVGAQPGELFLELLDLPSQILDDEIERIRASIPVFHDGPQPGQDGARLVDPLTQASLVGRARGDLETRRFWNFPRPLSTWWAGDGF